MTGRGTLIDNRHIPPRLEARKPMRYKADPGARVCGPLISPLKIPRRRPKQRHQAERVPMHPFPSCYRISRVTNCIDAEKMMPADFARPACSSLA